MSNDGEPVPKAAEAPGQDEPAQQAPGVVGETNTRDNGVGQALAPPRERMRILANRTWQDALSFGLNLGVIVLIVVFVGLLVAATFQDRTEITMIAAPKSFAEDKGYSPEVAARKLEDALYDVVAALEQPAVAPPTRQIADQLAPDRGINQARPTDVFIGWGQQHGVALASDRPIIMVPGVGVSIDSLASMIQGIVCPSCRKVITGEFTYVGGHLWLIVRANHRVVFVNKEGADPNQPDDLLRQAAIALFDTVDPVSGAIAHNNAGNARYREGKADDAIAEYRNAIRLNAKATVAHYNLGNVLRERGNLDEAVASYRTAIGLDPEDAKIHTSLGIALGKLDKTDDAIAEYRIAIKLDPKDASAQTNLGAALSAQGKPGEAIAQYQAAIKLDPSGAYTYSNQGNAYFEQGMVDEAIAAYRKAIELDPNYPYAHSGLSRVLAYQGNQAESLKERRLTVELDPGASYAHNSLGAALYDAGNLDDAIAEYRKAIALDGSNFYAHSSLGNALRDQGKFDEAIVFYQTVLRLNPQYAYVVLRLHLARLAAKQDDRTELQENAARLDKAKWPAPIVTYYVGTGTAEKVRKAAASGSDKVQRDQKCEADYYIGSLALVQGRQSEAKPLLQAAATGCAPSFVEATSAKSELRRLSPG